MLLVEADVLRDGGSLFATFRTDHGTYRTIQLCVTWPPHQPVQYGQLFDGPEVVGIGSELEKTIINQLDRWLARPMIDPLAGEHSAVHVARLRKGLDSRTGRPIDTLNGEAALSVFVGLEFLPAESLAELSGDLALSAVGPGASGLQSRVAEAWNARLSELSCAQARLLVTQRFGLRWLARPIATFVSLHPDAECDLYPGDLAINALRALDDLFIFAPEETRRMVQADFGWLEDAEAKDELGPLELDALGSLRSGRAAFLS